MNHCPPPLPPSLRTVENEEKPQRKPTLPVSPPVYKTAKGGSVQMTATHLCSCTGCRAVSHDIVLQCTIDVRIEETWGPLSRGAPVESTESWRTEHAVKVPQPCNNYLALQCSGCIIILHTPLVLTVTGAPPYKREGSCVRQRP